MVEGVQWNALLICHLQPPAQHEEERMEFTISTLQNALAPRPFRYYAQLGSTNDAALTWLREGGIPGSLVITDHQTHGRGRLSRSWFSQPSSALTFSLLLHPPTRQLSKITMIAALAVGDALLEIGVMTALKWPNDVLLKGRKVCGILSETAWEGSHCLGAVLGIGLNISTNFSGHPLAQTAISLSEVIDTVDRVDLLRRILARIDQYYVQIDSDTLHLTWRDRLLTIGQQIKVVQPNETLIGVAEDVDANGALLIRRADGTLSKVIAGNIMGVSAEP
ncbi:MAG: biotin--[acetyl-CoA-carboxylase] ligase [Phototrophicales bacterium]|nr:MAG: biotin--[acetyl-CoA-carboxylase] ligase [Phototrophicales bacterium]